MLFWSFVQEDFPAEVFVHIFTDLLRIRQAPGLFEVTLDLFPHTVFLFIKVIMVPVTPVSPVSVDDEPVRI